jgi:hypothetical protein
VNKIADVAGSNEDPAGLGELEIGDVLGLKTVEKGKVPPVEIPTPSAPPITLNAILLIDDDVFFVQFVGALVL